MQSAAATAITQAHKDAAAAFVAMLPVEAKPAASLFYRYALLLATGVEHESAMQQAKEQEAASICKLLSNDSYYRVEGKTMPQTAAEMLTGRVYERLQKVELTDEQKDAQACKASAQRKHLLTYGFKPKCPLHHISATR